MDLLFSLSVPPSIEDDVTAVTAVKMSPVVLPCHVQGSPQPTVTWTKGGAKLGSRGGSYRVLPTGKISCLKGAVVVSSSLDYYTPWCSGTIMHRENKIFNYVSMCINVFQCRSVGDNCCCAKPCWQVHMLSPQPGGSGSQTHLSHCAR